MTRMHAQRLSVRFINSMAELARKDAIAVSELSIVSAAVALRWPVVHDMMIATAGQYYRHDLAISQDEWLRLVQRDRQLNRPRLYHALKF